MQPKTAAACPGNYTLDRRSLRGVCLYNSQGHIDRTKILQHTQNPTIPLHTHTHTHTHTDTHTHNVVT